MQTITLRSARRAFTYVCAAFNLFCLSFFVTELLLAQAPAATAAMFVVNTLADSDDGTCNVANCTLREAINAANATPALDTIRFSAGLKGQIQLTSKFVISTSLILQGPGADALAIAPEQTQGHRIFEIDGTVPISVTLRGLTLHKAVRAQGNILVLDEVSLTIENCRFKDNNIMQFGGTGGAISNVDGDVILSNSVISNSAALHGGGISNGGNLTVISSTLQNNFVSRFGEGGAIYNYGGSLTITASTFISNGQNNLNSNSYEALGGDIANQQGGIANIANSMFVNSHGSAIYNTISDLSVTTSTFTGGKSLNSSSAIHNGDSEDDVGGVVTVTNSTVFGNSGLMGGAIGNRFGGNFTLVGSTVRDNVHSLGAGGILNEGGNFTILNSTIRDNRGESGAGVANMLSGTLTISNSTISGNRAIGFGEGKCSGIQNGGLNSTGAQILTISNSTISNNAAESLGGGICTISPFAQTAIQNSTIVGNRADNDDKDVSESMPDVGGGIYNSGGTTTLVSTILVDNYSGAAQRLDNIALNLTTPGTIASLGFNLSDSGYAGFNDDDIINSEPMLAPLGDFGGPTQTHALFAGSPAIDAGTGAHCPAFDQRGITRPHDGDADTQAICDIGAFEVDAPIEPEGALLHLPSLEKAPEDE